MKQEQHRPVGDAGQARAEAAVVALGLVLATDLLFHLLPFHPKGWVGEHVVEPAAAVAILGQGVAEDDVGHVLALDEHVRLADGKGLGVQLLAEHGQAGLGVVLLQVFTGDGEHTAGAGGGVVDGADHTRPGEHVVILDEDEVDHEPDDLTGGEVLPRGLVGEFSELADQLLEHQAHLMIADLVRVKIDLGVALGDLVEQAALGQALHLGVELEALEDVAHGG